MSIESPGQPPSPEKPKAPQLEKKFKDLPIINMAKNEDGSFQMKSIERSKDEMSTGEMSVRISDSMKKNYLRIIKKYAKEKELNINISEKDEILNSVITIKLAGRLGDIRDFFEQAKDLDKLLYS